MRPLPRFLVLYGALYAGFGVQSPFLPALLAAHGLTPATLGLVLAVGTAVRLPVAPAAGGLADRLGAARPVLTVAAAGAALAALLYLPAHGLAALLAVTVLQSA
ncbi:MAG: MFS transporter, partial [Chloroflexi bacterium]|nr:MFS transporter [Chloroflexota bacterium]